MEKPHTGLDDCLRMLQARFREMMSGLVVECVLLGALQVVGLLERGAHRLELGGVEGVAGGEELGPPAKLDLSQDRVRLLSLEGLVTGLVIISVWIAPVSSP